MSLLIDKCPTDPTLAAAYVTGASIALDAVAPYVAVIILDAIKREYDLLTRHFVQVLEASDG